MPQRDDVFAGHAVQIGPAASAVTPNFTHCSLACEAADNDCHILVADTSLEADRTEKLSIYAEAGIPDYWIVNLVDKQIEVYRNPSGKSYQQRLTYQGDEATHPLALPQVKLTPSQLFRT